VHHNTNTIALNTILLVLLLLLLLLFVGLSSAPSC
jgi:hypothetical protein